MQIFHVCNPVIDAETGEQTGMDKYDFICGNGTLFDQGFLVCDHAENVDCGASESLFDLVPFGEKEEPAFLDEEA